MRLTKLSLLKSLVLPTALLLSGAAYAQQASFAVAVTLHAASKPMAAAQLCADGKPMEMLGAIIRVDCPVVANANPSATGAGRNAATPGNGARQPEVTVTF